MGNPLCKPKMLGESLREFLMRKFSKRLDKRTLEKIVDDVLREDTTEKEPPNAEQLVLEDIENESFDDVNSCQSARPGLLDETQTVFKRPHVSGDRIQTPSLKSQRPVSALKTDREIHVRVESVSSGERSSITDDRDATRVAQKLSRRSVKSHISDIVELESESRFLYTNGAHFVPSPEQGNNTKRALSIIGEYCPTRAILETTSASPGVPSSPFASTRQALAKTPGSQNFRDSSIEERLRSSVMLRGGIQQGLRIRNTVNKSRQKTDTLPQMLSLEEKMQKLKKRDPSMPGPDKGIVWPNSLDNLSKTNAAYYVEQFLRSELFRQRCLRKLQGSKTWKNGLTPFQLWVIENEDTDVIQDVLHPFKTKSSNARAKVICWRGQTPPLPCTEN